MGLAYLCFSPCVDCCYSPDGILGVVSLLSVNPHRAVRPSLVVSRERKFLTKFVNNHNSICGAVSDLARRELNDLN